VLGASGSRYDDVAHVFIRIPYNGVCEDPFAAEVFGDIGLTTTSCDGKLETTYFSIVCVSFLSVSSIPPMCCCN
jgi:hypothetical protein